MFSLLFFWMTGEWSHRWTQQSVPFTLDLLMLLGWTDLTQNPLREVREYCPVHICLCNMLKLGLHGGAVVSERTPAQISTGTLPCGVSTFSFTCVHSLFGLLCISFIYFMYFFYLCPVKYFVTAVWEKVYINKLCIRTLRVFSRLSIFLWQSNNTLHR